MTDTSIILVADGLTPETLDSAIRNGDVPELAALAAENGLHVLTTVFPSVTGLAYIPMLTGMHPAAAGIPGLRWFDRSRQLSSLLGHSRSYVGMHVRSMNGDLSPHVITAWERARGDALGMESVVTRGLSPRNQLDHGIVYSARGMHAHLTGDIPRWEAIEDELARTLVRRIRNEKPSFVFAAFTSGDKSAHAGGIRSPGVFRSLKLVDQVAREIRHDAERNGRWRTMQLWVVSDHGHSSVNQHLDLADEIRSLGIRVRAHPWTLPDRSEAAVMVSGNCMAHVYLGLDTRQRQDWSVLQRTLGSRLKELFSHQAIDIVVTRTSTTSLNVSRRGLRAEIAVNSRGLSYRPTDGNPLGVEPFEDLCPDAVHERTIRTGYPDSIVQLAHLALTDRSGDVIISASPGWDLRQRYEPIDHVSSHGALHAAHMLVPLVGNRRPPMPVRRTADLFRFLVPGSDR